MLGFPYIKMAEIIRLYGPGEYRHWFDEGTMAFFGTRLPGFGVKTQWGNFFITSEQPPNGPRASTIRRQDLVTGDIETVGKFCGYSSYHDAKFDLQTHLLALIRQEAQCA